MHVGDLQTKVAQILDEERTNPTVDYQLNPQIPTGVIVKTVFSMYGLSTTRKEPHRSVEEYPGAYKFKSINYDLLSALFSQLGSTEKDVFFGMLYSRLIDSKAFRSADRSSHPNWDGVISESALIAEFCLRKRDTERFFRVLAEAAPSLPMIPLLCEIEEILCFDWRVLPEKELDHLSVALSSFLIGLNAKQESVRKAGVLISTGAQNVLKMAERIARRCESIMEQCRKAKYFYLKGALLEGLNLEVNQDKAAVESHLKKMGFSETLIGSLNHAEEHYLSTSPFDLKTSMSHLRSFLENLHTEAAIRLATKHQQQPPTGWGKIIVYLRDQSLLTKPQEGFVTGLYTLLSDEAVHPLIAQKEAARLSRNMVVEYGLMLLTQLEKAKV